MKTIQHAVFPVAGLGTRFLPATKASPKEMLPVVDKPLIQYAVEEAYEAGIRHMIFVTGRNKRAIEDHFDKAYEVETELAAKGKNDLLRLVQEILPKHVNCIYIRQAEPLGLGHAVLCARPVVGDEPFGVILADDLVDGDPPVMSQMAAVHEATQCSVLGVEEIPIEHSTRYGIIRPKAVSNDLDDVLAIVEKPTPEKAPSRIGVVGRYILSGRIFHHLEKQAPGSGGEIQLTDAIEALLQEERVVAYSFKGTRYDCGSKLGYLAATVAFGRKHPEVGAEFAEMLSAMVR